MAVVDHIVIRDKNTGVLKDREILADAENVVFEDEENLVTKYNDIYDIIPIKDDGTKGFGTAAVEDLPSDPSLAEPSEVVMGSDVRLFQVTEMTTNPDPEQTYTPNSLIIVVP